MNTNRPQHHRHPGPATGTINATLVVLVGLWICGLAVSLASAQTAPARELANLDTLSHSLERLAERVSPSVVQVVVVGYGLPDSNETTSDALLERRRSTGSGVIVDPAGYIVTNHHVVAAPAASA